MGLDELEDILQLPRAEEEAFALMAQLFPICRSITGDGVRQTLAIIQEQIPLALHEVPTGTQVLDWVVPKEWNIHDAYVKSSRGERLIDFRACNLHVVGYSTPIHRRMSLTELKPKLHSLPDQPDRVPFRTSFYREDWGFCIAHQQLLQLPEDEYEVHIDATLRDGSLSYGELLIPGREREEFLISAHVCHPSLANDNLSGVVTAVLIARYLLAMRSAGRTPRYSFRFVFAPVTIGAITWLARNRSTLHHIRHGLVLSLLGDSGRITYKRSQRENAAIDRAAEHVLSHSADAHPVQHFSPHGYDERQYCSPGFDLPVGCLMRTPFAQFPEYHTSADNLEFVSPQALRHSLATCLAILDVLERDAYYLSSSPHGEPQLGRHGVYELLAQLAEDAPSQLAILWVLNQSDGKRSLLDIAQRSGLRFDEICKAATVLRHCGLIAPSAAP